MHAPLHVRLPVRFTVQVVYQEVRNQLLVLFDDGVLISWGCGLLSELGIFLLAETQSFDGRCSIVLYLGKLDALSCLDHLVLFHGECSRMLITSDYYYWTSNGSDQGHSQKSIYTTPE